MATEMAKKKKWKRKPIPNAKPQLKTCPIPDQNGQTLPPFSDQNPGSKPTENYTH